MLKAVFISDLHLHPDIPEISARFLKLLEWVEENAASLYILGDFFNAWAGDDAIDKWSENIANRCKQAVKKGLKIYYIHGNRDFLLGKKFFKTAGFACLSDPHVIELNGSKILLSHGDRYCTLDKSHQRFMLLTRNAVFKTAFQWLPLSFRQRIVNHVRDKSMNNNEKTAVEMDVVASACLKDMLKHHVTTLIHGHTHKSGLNIHPHNGKDFQRFVLSDWDDRPKFLCYDKAKGIYFSQYNL